MAPFRADSVQRKMLRLATIVYLDDIGRLHRLRELANVEHIIVIEATLSEFEKKKSHLWTMIMPWGIVSTRNYV